MGVLTPIFGSHPEDHLKKSSPRWIGSCSSNSCSRDGSWNPK
jgi:hypothetical protein